MPIDYNKFNEKIASQLFNQELYFTTALSGGPGGQHVNKVSSKVHLYFNILQSEILDANERQLLIDKLAKYIFADGVLQLQIQIHRSQIANKQAAIKKFYTLLKQVAIPPIIRKPSKPSKAAIIKRLNKKRAHSQLKQLRTQKNWE